MKRKNIQNNVKGITLIALIITVIIMLILSGIVISFSIGDNGIFKLAKQAVKNYTNEQTKEETQVNDLLNYIEDNITDENTKMKSGLYCTNGIFIPWDELVNKYGLNIEKNYTAKTYQTEESSAYSVFSKNNFEGKLIIDESVKNIGQFAFSTCTGLNNVIIPNSVTNIEGYAFSNCTQLENVDMSNSVINIGMKSFSGCVGLTGINIPDSVTYIGMYAFQTCSSLATLYIPSSVVTTEAGSLVEGCSSNLEICCGAASKPSGWYDRWDRWTYNPSGGDAVFVYWNVTRKEYENYLKTGNLIIGNILLHVRRNMTNVTIPNTVIHIGGSAFYNCTELINVSIPNSVTTIQGGAFQNCIKLTNINIPDSVTYIGAYAFQNCSSLTTLYIPSSVITTEAGSIVYQCSSGLKVYCGATSKPSGWYNRWNYYSASGAVSAMWGITREQYENNYKK